MNILAEIIGLISGLMGLSVALPQLFKILKSKTHDGVSILAWIISLGNFTTWVTYGVRYNSFSQIVTNITATIFTAILVYVLISQKHSRPYAAAATTLVIFSFLFFGFMVPPLVLSMALFTMVLAVRVPQIISSYISFANGKETMVSKLTYALMVSSSVGWIAYGVMTGLWQNIVASSIALIASFIILFLETRIRKNI